MPKGHMVGEGRACSKPLYMLRLRHQLDIQIEMLDIQIIRGKKYDGDIGI